MAIAKQFVTGTVSSAAKSLADLLITAKNIKWAHISIEGGDLRFRYDGTAPTASVGHKILNGEHYVLDLEDAEELKLIRVSTDVTVMITVG